MARQNPRWIQCQDGLQDDQTLAVVTFDTDRLTTGEAMLYRFNQKTTLPVDDNHNWLCDAKRVGLPLEDTDLGIGRIRYTNYTPDTVDALLYCE